MHCFIWETSTGLSCRENFVRSPHLTEKVCFFLAGHFPEWKYVHFLKLEPNKHSDGVEERVGVFIPPELASFMEEGSASEARPGPMPSFTDVRPWWGCLIRHTSASPSVRWDGSARSACLGDCGARMSLWLWKPRTAVTQDPVPLASFVTSDLVAPRWLRDSSVPLWFHVCLPCFLLPLSQLLPMF